MRRATSAGPPKAVTRALMAAAVATLLVCDQPEVFESSDGESAELNTDASRDNHRVLAQEINYRLAWRWGAADSTDNGWEVETNLGYQVGVASGWIVTDSVQLTPCADEERGALFGAGVAHAIHGFVDDPSVVLSQHAESLAHPADLDLGPIAVEPTRYCQVHYLVARSNGDAQNRPADVELGSHSVFIDGTATTLEGVEIPLSVRSSLPIGALLPLVFTETSEVGAGVRVTITRDLGALFDDIDFETFRDEDIEKQLLLNLLDHLAVSVDIL